jgi:hypothetical protein
MKDITTQAKYLIYTEINLTKRTQGLFADKFDILLRETCYHVYGLEASTLRYQFYSR